MMNPAIDEFCEYDVAQSEDKFSLKDRFSRKFIYKHDVLEDMYNETILDKDEKILTINALDFLKNIELLRFDDQINSKAIHDVITSNELELVEKSLQNSKWDFRTLEGIARETKLPKEKISKLLYENKNLFRESLAPNSKGDRLFTLKSRPVKFREKIASLINYI